MSSPVASTSSTARPTFFGLFERAATPERDVEAQLPQPTPARTHAPRAASIGEEPVDPVDVFFGVSHSSRRSSLTLIATRDSRHDEIRQSTAVDSETLPPSYEDSLEPPVYQEVSDQPTLAMYLFKFGFLFPLFWIAGTLILLSPLRAPEDWETEKPEIVRRELIESMRRTEIKWARRCLAALSIFSTVVVAITLSTIFIMRS